jgi:hypothetical protein
MILKNDVVLSKNQSLVEKVGGREGRVSKKNETVIRFLESLSPYVYYIVFIIYKGLHMFGLFLVKKR